MKALEDAIQAVTRSVRISNKTLWAGRIMSVLPVLFMLFSGRIKLIKPTDERCVSTGVGASATMSYIAFRRGARFRAV